MKGYSAALCKTTSTFKQVVPSIFRSELVMLNCCAIYEWLLSLMKSDQQLGFVCIEVVCLSL